jgi:peptidoglycan hydrolase-like protein with peptidoglycan-binding domain
LKSAETALALTNIKNGVRVTITFTAPTFTPSPTETSDLFGTTGYITLRRGMTNSTAVRELQRRLKELGYFTDTIDGNYGPKTETAIKRFEYAIGNNPTGIATPELQAQLYDSEAPVRTPPPPTPSPTPTNSSTPTPPNATPAPTPTSTPVASETPEVWG